MTTRQKLKRQKKNKSITPIRANYEENALQLPHKENMKKDKNIDERAV